MTLMKKLFTFFAFTLAASSIAFAHCGTCGTGDKAHAEHGSHAVQGKVGCSDRALLTYLDIQDSLASDNLVSAQASAKELQMAGGACSIKGKECCLEMEAAAEGIASAKDISAARSSFLALSNDLIGKLESKGLVHGKVYKMHCPMAMEGKGASWIQDNDAQVRNPYYGASMLACGMAQATIGGAAKDCGDCADCEGCASKDACCGSKAADT